MNKYSSEPLCPGKKKFNVTDENKLLQVKERSGLSQNTAERIKKFQRQQEERYRRWH
jgi:hypothetical protein